MAQELYLIAHKVRGQPAFDIAERIQIGDEKGWIIPTSGHRAYPYHWAKLSEESMLILNPDYLPLDLEDHYTVHRASPTQPKPSSSGLLAQLGLGKPKVTIQRRI